MESLLASLEGAGTFIEEPAAQKHVAAKFMVAVTLQIAGGERGAVEKVGISLELGRHVIDVAVGLGLILAFTLVRRAVLAMIEKPVQDFERDDAA